MTTKDLADPRERQLRLMTARARQVMIDSGAFVADRPFDDTGTYWSSPRQPYGPDRFTWGRVVALHTVGPYQIIESLRNATGPYDPERLKERAVTDEHSFHIYVDGLDCGHSYGSLDKALLACVAWRADVRLGGRNRAANSRAATYMARMIELDEEVT